MAVVEYGAAVRESAFQIWAYVADRNAAATVRELIGGEFAGAVELPDGLEPENLRRVISNWVREDGWEERADREVHAIAPALRARTQMTIALATAEAASMLRRVVRGEMDEREAKARTPAALGLLDRGGFSPVGTRVNLGEIDAPPSLSVSAGENLDDLSPEGLRIKEQEYRARARQLTDRGKVSGLAR